MRCSVIICYGFMHSAAAFAVVPRVGHAVVPRVGHAVVPRGGHAVVPRGGHAAVPSAHVARATDVKLAMALSPVQVVCGAPWLGWQPLLAHQGLAVATAPSITRRFLPIALAVPCLKLAQLIYNYINYACLKLARVIYNDINRRCQAGESIDNPNFGSGAAQECSSPSKRTLLRDRVLQLVVAERAGETVAEVESSDDRDLDVTPIADFGVTLAEVASDGAVALMSAMFTTLATGRVVPTRPTTRDGRISARSREVVDGVVGDSAD